MPPNITEHPKTTQMASKQDVASLIVDFLNTALKNGDVPEDNRDSIEFAVEGITEAFSVEESAVASTKAKFGNKSLSELLSAPQSASSEKSAESVPVHIDESDEKVKEQAEALKLEGNKAMAAKDYETAVSKYTAAIELVPTNAVYLSNRAAAYSSMRTHDLALADAKKATEVEPTYAKGWSRLGLAHYALGDAESAMKAYEQGLSVEGSTPSDAMKRGYETAKQKVSDNLMNSLDKGTDASDSLNPESASSSSGGSGMPDLSAFANMMGGGAGGAGGLGGLAGLMNNPQLMQAAAQMMKDPNALSNLMNNPQVKSMANSMGINPENLDGLANNPMLANLAKNFMGGDAGNNSEN